MNINDVLKERKITKYQLAKRSGVPYSTVSDVCRGAANLAHCSAETIYKIAKELHVSMEQLIAQDSVSRIDFELYKSNVCHRLKEKGDIDFVYDTLMSNDIRHYCDMKWYPEALYLLAMVDYISGIQKMPLCSKYDDIRLFKLAETLYPADVLIAASVMDDDRIKKEARLRAIPEFMRYNIIENEVRSVA